MITWTLGALIVVAVVVGLSILFFPWGLGVVVLPAVLWILLSYRAQRHRLPDECALRDYEARVWRRFGFVPDLARLERTYVPINGNCLQVDVLEAAPDSPTVVFSPGTAVYAELQIQFLYALNDRGYNVVAYDPRGHGRSSGLRGTFTVSELVADAIAVIGYARDRFGGKVGMSGSSQGGVVSFYVAATEGAADAVMCHNIAVLDARGNLALSTLRIPRFLVPIALRLFHALPFLVIPVTWYLPFDKLKLKNGESAVKFLAHDPLAVTAYSLRAVGSLGKTLPPCPVEDITTPVMLLASTGDVVFPESYVQGIFDRLTCRKKFVNKQGLSHLLLQEYVDEVIGPIAGWFDETLRTPVGASGPAGGSP